MARKNKGEERNALRVWLQIARCNALLEGEVSRRLREGFGQSLSRFDVLSQLERAKTGRLAITQLSSQLIASSGNISRLLDRMESDGLLRRNYLEGDRRVIEIEMTEAGKNLFAGMAASQRKWIDDLMLDFPEQKKEDLFALLVEAFGFIDRKIQSGK